MSNKSILNDHCQKNRLAMPVYESKSTGLPHDPSWYCKLTILGLEFYSPDSSKTKTDAEQIVAKIALDYINNNTTSPLQILKELTITPTSIYVIDLENKPMFNQKLKSECIYIGFHNSLHHSIPKYTDWRICDGIDLEEEFSISNQLIYLIEGGVTDLVDHFMTMFMYPLAVYLKSNSAIKNIYIVSGDKSGFCTKLCLEQALKWNGIENITIKNVISI